MDSNASLNKQNIIKKVIMWIIALVALFTVPSILALIEIAVPLGAVEKSIVWMVAAYLIFKLIIFKKIKDTTHPIVQTGMDISKMPKASSPQNFTTASAEKSLILLAVRKKIFQIINSGWGRLFLVLWIIWLGFLGYRYYQYEGALTNEQQLAGYVNEWGYKAAIAREEGSETGEEIAIGEMKHYEELQASNAQRIGQLDDADWNFYLWGILAPLLGYLACIWIAAGFKRTKIIASDAE